MLFLANSSLVLLHPANCAGQRKESEFFFSFTSFVEPGEFKMMLRRIQLAFKDRQAWR